VTPDVVCSLSACTVFACFNNIRLFLILIFTLVMMLSNIFTAFAILSKVSIIDPLSNVNVVSTVISRNYIIPPTLLKNSSVRADSAQSAVVLFSAHSSQNNFFDLKTQTTQTRTCDESSVH
jgi:hypothetical protein